MMRTNAGAALRLLSIPVAIGLLTACGGQPAAQPAAPPQRSAKADIDEVDALVAATKQHQSLANAANAGPPIVDVPKAGGTVDHHHMAN